jgi:peptide deformylase
MTKLVILEYPDPRLRTKASPVARVDAAVQQLADDLIETMYAYKGIGLSATQVDVHQRLLVMDVSPGKDHPQVFINPEIIESVGREPVQEGCLSVPGIYDKVQRATRIRVRALGRDGKAFEQEAESLEAVCIQHEMDHLEGQLFVDYLSELKRLLIRRRLAKERRLRANLREARAGVPAL